MTVEWFSKRPNDSKNDSEKHSKAPAWMQGRVEGCTAAGAKASEKK
jgi:hypothetical protein